MRIDPIVLTCAILSGSGIVASRVALDWLDEQYPPGTAIATTDARVEPRPPPEVEERALGRVFGAIDQQPSRTQPPPRPLAPQVGRLVATVDADAGIGLVIGASDRGQIVRIGDLLDDRQVVRVERRRVVLREADGRLVELAFGADRTNGGTPRAVGPPDPYETVRAIDADRVVLPRSVLDRALAAVSERGEQLLVPSFREGRAIGFTIRTLRADGLLARLGARAGDLVLSIDGTPLDSPAHALEVYGRLSRLREVPVELERRGERVRRTIVLQ